MNQTELIEAACTKLGLKNYCELAELLEIRRSRLCEMKKGVLPADEYEIFHLAKWAGVEPIHAAAAVRKNRERNPAKRAFWERIENQYRTADR